MQKMVQAGAIPFRPRGEDWEFLLVTSQRGNWIFPKGIVEPGESPEETALKECREEAGIRGSLLSGAVGSYPDRKWKRDCEVLMFLLRYEEDVEPWEEGHIRERRWCPYEDAELRIKKPALKSLLREARARLAPPAGSPPPSTP